MTDTYRALDQASLDSAIVPAGAAASGARPIWLVRPRELDTTAGIEPAQRQWLKSIGFKGAARRHALLPDQQGKLSGAVLGLGEAGDLAPSEPAEGAR